MVKIKVFCKKEEQRKLADEFRIEASYDNFVVGEADETQLNLIRKRYPAEKMQEFNLIKLKNNIIDTSSARINKEGDILPHHAYSHAKKLSKGPHHYLVQFVGPIKEQWTKNIMKMGGKVCEPLPNYSYVFELDERTLAKVRALSYVHWIGHYDPSYRVSQSVLNRAVNPLRARNPKKLIPKLDKTSAAITASGKNIEHKQFPKVLTVPQKYSIEFFTEKNLKDAKKLITKQGVKIVNDSDNKRIIVDLQNSKKDTADILSNLSEIHGVKTIEDIKVRRLFNNVATSLMNANDVAGNVLGLTGKGEIVGIADTGLDSGDHVTIHPDFRGRIKGLKSYPINPVYDKEWVNNPGNDDGVKDVSSGHGTHVAGSVLGDGSSSKAANDKSIVKGIAYEARLLFQAVEQWMDWTDAARLYWQQNYGRQPEQFGLFGLPTNIADLFGYAYRKGCRIHTNSWGGGDPGEYDQQCHDLDKFVWENKDFVILFAAGNDGRDANHDGKIDFGSVTPPGTAKNCITVGASENERPEFVNETYGGTEWWPSDYPVPPIRNDPMTDSAKTDVVAFSSRGPTADDRIKPDVVCPGTFILSTRSRYIAANNTGWAKYPPNKDYFFMGGTSMATPLLAGGAAIIRQFLRTKMNILKPSAALIKAVMIHGARRMNYRYAADKRVGLYDMEQGWGLVDIKESLNPHFGKIKYLDVKIGLKTGQTKVINIKVNDPNVQLKITMAYSDYPGTSIINNLNLVVTDSNGKRYYGNVFEEPFDSKLDTTNNVESVVISKPIVGDYKIEVIGASVVSASQDFALVYSGGFT
jgi:serine protease AprX